MRRVARAPQGFTLLEVTMSITVLMIIMAVIVNAIVGARKAEGAAVTTSLLKAGGARAMKNLYLELSQSRRLLASVKGDGASPDLGTQYYTLMARPAAPADMPATGTVFPQINPNGGFGVDGTTPGTLDPSTVGNALAFVAPGPPMVLSDSDVYVSQGWFGGDHPISSKPYQLPTYKFVLYHLVQVNLPPGAPAINGLSYTTQLMRWESGLYLQKSDVDALFNRMSYHTATSAASTQTMFANLTSHPPTVVGIWDASATTASSAFVLYPALNVVNLPFIGNVCQLSGSPTVISSPTIPMAKQTWAITTSLSGYATSMMAYNTVSNLNFVVPGLKVPAYASAPTSVPYGFEVAIAGPASARTVLVRMALAARLNSGLNLNGIAHQEVVKVFDM